MDKLLLTVFGRVFSKVMSVVEPVLPVDSTNSHLSCDRRGESHGDYGIKAELSQRFYSGQVLETSKINNPTHDFSDVVAVQKHLLHRDRSRSPSFAPRKKKKKRKPPAFSRAFPYRYS